ncbi:MAG: biotin/lipoyl-containing protein, partial [Bacteroidota bacterium]
MFQLIMPKMGESVAEATILKWLKKEGDTIEADEPVLEIATDKVDSEVPSPAAGILSKRLFEEGQVVKVGEVIATITPIGQNATTAAPTQSPMPAVTVQPVTEVKQSQTVTALANGIVNSEVKRISDSGRFYSPLVR